MQYKAVLTHYRKGKVHRVCMSLCVIFKASLCVNSKWTHLSQSDYERKHHQTDLSVPLRCSSVMVKMACEREEAAFIAVEPTVRAEFPSSRQPTISWAVNTCLSVKPTIWKKGYFQ